MAEGVDHHSDQFIPTHIEHLHHANIQVPYHLQQKWPVPDLRDTLYNTKYM